ncbi:MAG: hypothetical protein IJ106_05680 [Parasporobacterium sp.]|nr:hypothetical protein [Parasporobacterium sp.]
MKAVVLEIKDGYAAVLRDDGTVDRIQRQCEVGDVIEVIDAPETSGSIREPIRFRKTDGRKAAGTSKAAGTRKTAGVLKTDRFRRVVRGTAIAAAVLLAAVIGTGGYYYTTDAAASVVVDTGTATVTLYLNHFDRVIQVESDDDAVTPKSLEDTGIRFSTLAEALNKVDALVAASEPLSGQDNLSGSGNFNDSETQDPDSVRELWIRAKNETTFEQLSRQAEDSGYQVGRMDEIPEGHPDDTIPEERPGDTMPEGWPGEKPEEMSVNVPEDMIQGDMVPDTPGMQEEFKADGESAGNPGNLGDGGESAGDPADFGEGADSTGGPGDFGEGAASAGGPGGVPEHF